MCVWKGRGSAYRAWLKFNSLTASGKKTAFWGQSNCSFRMWRTCWMLISDVLGHAFMGCCSEMPRILCVFAYSPRYSQQLSNHFKRGTSVHHMVAVLSVCFYLQLQSQFKMVVGQSQGFLVVFLQCPGMCFSLGLIGFCLA